MNALIEKYKAQYGDGEITFEGNALSIPLWLVRLFIERSGLRSRKNRHVKKRLRREVLKAIQRGAEM